MELARWLRFAPLAAIAVLGTAGLVRPAAMAAGDRPWVPHPCPARGVGAPPGEATGTTWYRLNPVLDVHGSLTGRRLTVGAGTGAPRFLALDPESFASGPVDGLLLVGSDDGKMSRLRLVDIRHSCAVDIAGESAVIRSAILEPGHGAILEHRVDRSTRADLGVWRRPLDGGTIARVLEPLGADTRFGPTFSTDLRLAADGRLVVSTCGQRACRVRVSPIGGGPVALVDGVGPALGVHGSTLVTEEPCAGLPCAVLAVDLAGGERRVLVRDAGQAVLGGPGDGFLVYEDRDGGATGFDLARDRNVPVTDERMRPVAGGSVATTGAETPGDTLPVTRDGVVGAGLRALSFDTGAPTLVTPEELQ